MSATGRSLVGHDALWCVLANLAPPLDYFFTAARISF